MPTTTKDTGESVIVPATPERDPWDQDGYEWMARLEHQHPDWDTEGAWGADGWDLGDWPLIVFALAETTDGAGSLHGYCTYVEGDVTAHWYRTEQARAEAISREAYWYWASGQADGPDHLRGTDPRDFQAIPGLCEPYNPIRH